MSIIFEKIIFNLINKYIEPFLSNLPTGFRKNHNTQYYQLKMLKKWQEALDKCKLVDAIFMDFSKVFDTLNHDLLIANLEAYGLFLNYLRYIPSHLNQSLQKKDGHNSFSLWTKIIADVPILFDIYINNKFLSADTAFLENYADDTTLYSIQGNPKNKQPVLN